MRWALRHQILVPMAGVMLATLATVSVLNAYLAARREQRRLEHQIRDIARTLQESSFPLTDAVLRQMRGLSGAEFAVVDAEGRVVASTRNAEAFQKLPRHEAIHSVDSPALRDRWSLDGASFFHVVQSLALPRGGPRPANLHILYPEAGYREAWRDAVYPPLAIGSLSIALVCLLAVVVASRLGRPITRLQAQVERIAEGDFSPMELPSRNDELRDLAVSVNRMASMLHQYEQEVRRAERLRTLSQLGGGLAHQLRNSATGCRMALDLHAMDCPHGASCESLEVARRQLEFMEKYLQRFLSIGQIPDEVELRPVDVAECVERVLPLLRPAAQHAGVPLRWEPPADSIVVLGDAAGIEQVLINIVLNAIEAATRGSRSPRSPAQVIIELRSETDSCELRIMDTGPGPGANVQDRLFEAFVTEKPDGVGLGLAMAREIVRQHHGTVTWSRVEPYTCFSVILPLQCREPDCAEPARR